MEELFLKKCPFCGGEATVAYLEKEDVWYVDCALEFHECPCIPSTWHYPTKEQAIRAWNTRGQKNKKENHHLRLVRES